jgi:oligopeptide/dipeptide ABC transporter ATP-binding protein
VVRHLADRVGVMFLGRCVETGDTAEIFASPLHPYTKLLLSAVPVCDPHKRNRRKMRIAGEIPSAVDIPPGCRFHPRCPCARDICRKEEPPVCPVGERTVACHFPLYP